MGAAGWRSGLPAGERCLTFSRQSCSRIYKCLDYYTYILQRLLVCPSCVHGKPLLLSKNLKLNIQIFVFLLANIQIPETFIYVMIKGVSSLLMVEIKSYQSNTAQHLTKI